jgi:hypothetical protein
MTIEKNTRDATLVSWTQNFIRHTQPMPADFGLTVNQVDSLAELLNNMEEIVDLCSDPATATRPAFETKRTEKAALVQACQSLIKIVQAFPALTNTQRVDLQINVADRSPSRRPIPTERATIEIAKVTFRTVSVIARTEEGRAAKPPLTQSIEVFTYVGDMLPTSMEDWRLTRSVSRSRFEIEFPQSPPAGQTVFIAVAYQNASGMGPMSQPIQTNLPGGLVRQAVETRGTTDGGMRIAA